MSRNRIIAIALAALVVAAALGWWGYGEHQRREQRKTIIALLADTGAQLRAGLTATAEGPEALSKHEEQLASAERNLAALKGMDARREPALADAADDYLLTGREILKRVVNVRRYRQLLSESLQALGEHLRTDYHAGAWFQEAAKARERVNKDHRDLGLAADALDQLLQTLPASQKKIAPHVEPAVLIEGGVIDAARARALETAKQATAEVEKMRQLGPSADAATRR